MPKMHIRKLFMTLADSTLNKLVQFIRCLETVKRFLMKLFYKPFDYCHFTISCFLLSVVWRTIFNILSFHSQYCIESFQHCLTLFINFVNYFLLFSCSNQEGIFFIVCFIIRFFISKLHHSSNPFHAMRNFFWTTLIGYSAQKLRIDNTNSKNIVMSTFEMLFGEVSSNV